MGIVVPFIFGAAVALAFGYATVTAVFVGLILTATSVSISAQTLMELGFLRSREGLALLAAAVVDDILVVLLLSGLLAVFLQEGNAGIGQYILIGGRIVLYLIGAILVGTFVLSPLVRRVSALPISEGVIALVVVTTLFFAWASESIGGMAAITGSFIAGLFFARSPLRHQIEQGMHTIAYGLLVPVFFISVGLRANVWALSGEAIMFTLAIIVVAVLGKILGCGLGASASGFSRIESLRVGVGMVSAERLGLLSLLLCWRPGSSMTLSWRRSFSSCWRPLF